MSGENKGICRLCGYYKDLTVEHIPPRRAFNDVQIRVQTFEDFVAGRRWTKFRRGMNKRSLCETCNNNTGAWYAKSLIEWCQQGFEWYNKLSDKGLLYIPYYLNPLNALKQILVMALAMTAERAANNQEELRRFLLNREHKYLPPSYEVYVYFNTDGNPRFASGTVVTRVDVNRMSYVEAEVSLPPFGYCVCRPTKNYRSLAEFSGLCDITWFSHYDYNEWTPIQLRLPARETHEPFPLDYRSKSEVEQHYINMNLKPRHK